GSRTPYNANRIRAYLDDIPLTSGDGISTLEDLDPASIGTIEILKGPSSALYGSGLGGIVKLSTPYPEKTGFSARIEGKAGSFGSGKLGLTGARKMNSLALSGGVTRTFTEGYRQNSRYTRNNLFLNTRYFGEKTSLSVTLSLIDLLAMIPSSLHEDDFRNRPEKAAENWLTAKGFESYTKALIGTRIESEIGRGVRNTLVVFGSYNDPYELRPFNVLDERSVSTGFREYLELELSGLRISTGIEYFHEWFNWKIFETMVDRQGNMFSDNDEIRRYGNFFILAQWRPAEAVLIDAGFNINGLQYSLVTRYRIDSLDQSGSYTYDPVLSPRLGISIRLTGDHHLYASAGHGFSAPSLEETLLPEGTINTGLEPETGWNLEIGSRGRSTGGRITYDATLYTVVLDNLLVTERVTEDIFTGINAGKALNTGAEFWTRFSLFPGEAEDWFNTGLMAGYTVSMNRFLEFVDDGIDYSGKNLPGIPVHRLNTLINVRFGALDLFLQYQFTGRQWMDDANEHVYGGYHLFHSRIEWKHDLRELPFGIRIHAG
ncbi:MAG: TonB-dependent receptor, partial [Bacteroidetes bacterium]